MNKINRVNKKTIHRESSSKKKSDKKKKIKISISNMKNQSLIINSDKELLNSYISLIENEGYIKFLNEYHQKGYLTDCARHNHNFIISEKDYKYPYPNSNIQFITYIKNAIKYKYFGDLAKFQSILTKYISFNFSFKVMSYITKNQNKNLKDTEIIEFILSSNENLLKKNEIKRNIESCDPDLFMIESIVKNIINSLSSVNPKYENKNYEELKFLDLGCEYLNYSKKIKNMLKISNEQYYGLHLPNIKIPNNNNIKSDNFKLLTNVHKLPFDDNSFDFIYIHTFSQRINDLTALLNELNRIIKPNGFLFLISIMAIDKNDCILSDIINTLKNVFIHKINIHEYIKNPEYMRYLNYIQTDYVMKKAGFKYNSFGLLRSKMKESITQNNNQSYAIYKVEKKE